MTRPIVFGGPSLSLVPAEQLRELDVRGPARRGDADKLLREPPGTLLIVDGLFGASMAITPLECRQLIGRGWRLLGASSIGALRASELWNAGMLGVGRVYQLLRLGVIRSDADVAVAYHPDNWSELTVSMVQVYALVEALGRREDLEVSAAFPSAEAGAAPLIEAARAIYWLERSWSSLWAAWRRAGAPGAVLTAAQALARDAALHPKKQDAREAIALLVASRALAQGA